MKQSKKRKPGRPRSTESHENILSAAMLLAEKIGYENVTLQNIADEAKASRQTIYRWWDSKADLYMEALAEMFSSIAQLFPTVSENSLENYLTILYKEVLKVRDVLLGITCHSLRDERFKKKYRARIEERRKYIFDILSNTIKHNKTNFPVSTDTITDMLIGTMWYRLIYQNLPLNKNVIKEQIKVISLLITKVK